MISTLLLLATSTVALEKLEGCVSAKTREFSAAREAADVTVQGAMAACVVEQANFRAELQTVIKANSPQLSAQSAKEVEQLIFETGSRGASNRALVQLITDRTKNAPNQ